MIEGQKPQYLHGVSFSADIGLELVEAILLQHSETIRIHSEAVHVIRSNLVPFMLNLLADRSSFPLTLRAVRLVPLILANLLNVMVSECEMILSLLNHMLDPEAAPLWKRVLCMEVFRALHNEPAHIRNIYVAFDEQTGSKDIIADHFGIMVRLAAEKPSVIGLGSQSSMPPSSSQLENIAEERAALQAEGFTGTIGAGMSLKSSESPGLSIEWSVPKVPCIDQLDKADPPFIPPAYLYTLVLNCINSFSDGLARFLMPFSMPQEVRSKRKQRLNGDKDQELDATTLDPAENSTGKVSIGRAASFSRKRSNIASRLPVNPLSLQNHAHYNQIRSSGLMADRCWPALLAACSTFLHAALDAEFYRNLVRSIQKFTQISAILRLATPRDAFLTTLGKNAVPQGVVAAYSYAHTASSLDDGSSFKRRQSSLTASEASPNPSRGSSFEIPRHSVDGNSTTMNIRNLLCMRALLNLGIALGPVLDNAWYIIFETLQQADVVINNVLSQRRPVAGRQQSSGNVHDFGSSPNLGEMSTEIAAVRSATTRLIESCSELPDDAFRTVLLNLTTLVRDIPVAKTTSGIPISPLPGSPMPDRRASTSAGSLSKSISDTHANDFVVQTLHNLIRQNDVRLLESDPSKSGWIIILDRLIEIVASRSFNSETRYKAAEAIASLALITSTLSESAGRVNDVCLRGLSALSRLIQSLHVNEESSNKNSRSCDADIHRLALETLTSILERCGDSLVVGWDSVFKIIVSVFEEDASNYETGLEAPASRVSIRPKALSLIRPSFGSLELICSDFLGAVPSDCVTFLLQAVHYFGIQQQDLNISLKSTTLCWNISVYLTQGEGLIKLSTSSPNEDQDLQDSADFDRLELHERPVLLRLLTCLVDVTVDLRMEVRNSALHTIFRIFVAYGDRVPKNGWTPSMRSIIVKIMSENERAYQESQKTRASDLVENLTNWNSTATLIVEGTATLFEQYISAMVVEPHFGNLWREIIRQLKGLLDRGSLDLGTGVLKALSRTLAEVAREKLAFTSCLVAAWELWLDYELNQDHEKLGKPKKDNEHLMLAYLDCMRNLYALKPQHVELELTRLILERLRFCALASKPSAYIRDVDSMTTVQAQILTGTDMLISDTAGTQSEIIKCTTFFMSLAYDQRVKPQDNVSTYIALSKSSMDLLLGHVSRFSNLEDVYSSGAMTGAIRALGIPIKLRYNWIIEGKEETTWQKATTTMVSLLDKIATNALQFQKKRCLDSAFWPEVLSACSAVMSADLSSYKDPLRVVLDQDFDIQALEKFKLPLHLALGSGLQSDDLCRRYVNSVFQNSIIHEPHPQDLPQARRPLLECLQSKHIGRVKPLPPTRRSKMSYFLLGWLFDLVSFKDNSPENLCLAQAAAPYLVLRVGIVLKAYICDHPLRGLMPQPASQRQELTYLLQRMVELESEPTAFPDTGRVNAPKEKHLHAIYPLVVKALKVAFRDERTQEALVSVIEAVEDEFT